MNEIVLLSTRWDSEYWKKSKEAPYPKNNSDDFDWSSLNSKCPLLGIGVYTHNLNSNLFQYLLIKGIRTDVNSGGNFFDIEPIGKASSSSKDLIEKLGSKYRPLYTKLESQYIMAILKNLNENLPPNWITLEVNTPIQRLESNTEEADWKTYIGKYYLALQADLISNIDFENKVASLLTALGFAVTLKGNKIKGEYCDGIASYGDFAIVYDCKNIKNYYPTAEHNRALTKYLEDEKIVRKENLYSTFIAKSLSNNVPKDFCIGIEELLYLLYKKLTLGEVFSLRPLKKMIINREHFTIFNINNNWN